MNIAGVDEVGRGAIFGPVFAAAVVLNTQSEEILKLLGLKDSKLLTPKKRGILDPIIKQKSYAWGIGISSANEIDKFGIRRATEKAMIRALDKINCDLDLVLVDGILPIQNWEGKQKVIKGGDNKVMSISAASVIAKEARDLHIKLIAKKFQGYFLENHVGYGTKKHREAIKKLGITNLHRKTFLSKIIAENI